MKMHKNLTMLIASNEYIKIMNQFQFHQTVYMKYLGLLLGWLKE